MAWIESHEELENHPKVIHLESLMGWNRDETIGKLHRFWWWCLKYAPTGDLRKFNDAQVAGGVVLNVDDSKRFVEAMISSCWIDRSQNVFRVHEWIQYAGTYLRNSKFKRDPARWQETLAVYKVVLPEDKSTNCQPTVKGLSLVPDQPTNQPTNQTTDGVGINIGSFAKFWNAYPKTERKTGEVKCEKHWKAHNLDSEVEAIAAGLKAWKQSETWTKDGGKYICGPHVWLNERRWETEIAVVPRVNEIGMPILTREEIMEKLNEVNQCPTP